MFTCFGCARQNVALVMEWFLSFCLFLKNTMMGAYLATGVNPQYVFASKMCVLYTLSTFDHVSDTFSKHNDESTLLGHRGRPWGCFGSKNATEGPQASISTFPLIFPEISVISIFIIGTINIIFVWVLLSAQYCQKQQRIARTSSCHIKSHLAPIALASAPKRVKDQHLIGIIAGTAILGTAKGFDHYI